MKKLIYIIGIIFFSHFFISLVANAAATCNCNGNINWVPVPWVNCGVFIPLTGMHCECPFDCVPWSISGCEDAIPDNLYEYDDQPIFEGLLEYNGGNCRVKRDNRYSYEEYIDFI